MKIIEKGKKGTKVPKEAATASYLHLLPSSNHHSAATPKMINLSIASPSSVSLPSKLLTSTSKSSFNANALQIRFPFPFRASPKTASAGARHSPAVIMAKKDEELKEIRTKTTDQINEEVVDLKGELLMLRLQKSARNEFKSSEFRRMRKRVARMLTIKREREIEEGVGKRLSRKLDRKWKKSIVVRPPPSLKKLREEEAAAEEAQKSA